MITFIISCDLGFYESAALPHPSNPTRRRRTSDEHLEAALPPAFESFRFARVKPMRRPPKAYAPPTPYALLRFGTSIEAGRGTAIRQVFPLRPTSTDGATTTINNSMTSGAKPPPETKRQPARTNETTARTLRKRWKKSYSAALVITSRSPAQHQCLVAWKAPSQIRRELSKLPKFGCIPSRYFCVRSRSQHFCLPVGFGWCGKAPWLFGGGDRVGCHKWAKTHWMRLY